MADDITTGIEETNGSSNGTKRRITIREQSTEDRGSGHGDRNTTGNGTGSGKTRGRPPGSKNKKTNVKSVSLDEQKKKSEFVVIMLMSVIAASGSSLFGHDASFTPIEEGMIKIPMIDYLSKLEPSNFDLMEKYLNPLMIGFGFISWGGRNYRKMSERIEKEKQERIEVENARVSAESGQEITSDYSTDGLDVLKSDR